MTGVLGDKVKEELKTRIPLGRMGSARDVASAIVFWQATRQVQSPAMSWM